MDFSTKITDLYFFITHQQKYFSCKLFYTEIFTFSVCLVYEYAIQNTILFYNIDQYSIFQTALVHVARLKNVYSYFMTEQIQLIIHTSFLKIP